MAQIIGPALLAPDDVKPFVLAGKAFFSLKNPRTGNRFTYKVYRKKGYPPQDVWFVSVKTDAGYAYIGTIMQWFNRPVDLAGMNQPKQPTFRVTKKSAFPETDKRVGAFAWFWRNVIVAPIPQTTLEVYHDGRCGRCGMHLTNPASVVKGIGPECEKIRGRNQRPLTLAQEMEAVAVAARRSHPVAAAPVVSPAFAETGFQPPAPLEEEVPDPKPQPRKGKRARREGATLMDLLDD